MKLYVILLIMVLLNINAFGQKISVKDVNVRIEDRMAYIVIPEKKDNITRVVEINRIVSTTKSLKTGDNNSYKKSVKNCSSQGKTLLTNGEYILKITIKEIGKEDYVEEIRFLI